MNQPLVSVVIPFYSGVDWLIEALDSVINQTYKNIEILVINDGSPEDLDEVKNKFKSRIQIIYKKNGGPASARNLGIEKSKGKYVAFLDSDDIWLPQKLEKQISYMESNHIIWSQHSYEMFWENKNKTKIIDTSKFQGNVYQYCLTSFKVQTSCVVVLREAMIKYNIIFPVEKRFGQDGAFYRKLAAIYPLGYINDVLSKFRIRGSNAGFRAKVQIDDRASIWNEIRSNKKVVNNLPKPIVCVYKLLRLESKFVNFLNKTLIKSDKLLEYISKLLYLIPYIIIKLYAYSYKKDQIKSI